MTLSYVMNKLNFPEEAQAVLNRADQDLRGCPRGEQLLEQAWEPFFRGESAVFRPLLDQAGTESGICPYTVHMVFLLRRIPDTEPVYRSKGLSEARMWDTYQDLRYKLMECRAAYGVWGTFVIEWFSAFYRAERFTLGRMQFESIPFPFEAWRGIHRGQQVVNCHIPSSGPLTPALVQDALHRAWEFFPELRREDGLLPVVCHSWLLYPPQYGIYAPGSNLEAFSRLFEVVEADVRRDYTDFWRLFGVLYTEGALDTAPADTGLRRRMLQYLKTGRMMGCGYGVLLYDGEKVAVD